MNLEREATKWWAEMMRRGERVASIEEIPDPDQLRFLVQHGFAARVTSEYWILKTPKESLEDVPPLLFRQVVERILSHNSYSSTFLPHPVRSGWRGDRYPLPHRAPEGRLHALPSSLKYLTLPLAFAAAAVVIGYTLTGTGQRLPGFPSLTESAEAEPTLTSPYKYTTDAPSRVPADVAITREPPPEPIVTASLSEPEVSPTGVVGSLPAARARPAAPTAVSSAAPPSNAEQTKAQGHSLERSRKGRSGKAHLAGDRKRRGKLARKPSPASTRRAAKSGPHRRPARPRRR